MADLSIFKLDSQAINIKDTTARQTADNAKTLATIASGNATTALNKINELESDISALNSSLAKQSKFVRHGFPNAASVDIGNAANGNWLCGFIVCNIIDVGNFVGYFVCNGSATATVTKIAGDWITPTLTISNGKIILSASNYKIANYVVLIND